MNCGNTMEDCYATGDGRQYTGGLVGYVRISSNSSYPRSGTVSKSFAAGSVTARNASSTGVWAGGVAGYVSSSLLQCRFFAQAPVAPYMQKIMIIGLLCKPVVCLEFVKYKYSLT
jgi:hypothetical protein